MSPTGQVLRAELRRMRLQGRLQALAAVCALGPLLLAVVLAAQTGLPRDTLFGRSVHDSGFALPLLVLGFAGTWVLPLLPALIAGDAYAGEDAHRTWKAVLTRSVGRPAVFWGKALAVALCSALLLAVLAVSSLLGGLARRGTARSSGCPGTPSPPARAGALVVLSWASVLLPLLGFAALSALVSLLTRSIVAGIGVPVVPGLLLQLLALLGALGPAAVLLPTTAFTSWHGLVTGTPYLGPLWQGALVSLVWGVPALLLARRALVVRDVLEA